jgi:hypothetical protein
MAAQKSSNSPHSDPIKTRPDKSGRHTPDQRKALSQGAEARWEKNHSERTGVGRKKTEARWEGNHEDEGQRPKHKGRGKGAEARWERDQAEN